MRLLSRTALLIYAVIILAASPVGGAPEAGGFSLTAEERSYLDALRARPITIAYSYDMLNPKFGGASDGMIRPVLDVLKNELGLTLNMVKANWHDAFIQVESGEVDFYGPIAISQSRRDKYIIVEPFYRSYSKIITRVEEPVNSMIGLYNRSIGLLEGSVISRTMQAYLGPNGKTIYFPSMDEMISGLKSGMIAAFATVDNAEFEILSNDDIWFEFSIDNFYVDQGLIGAREDIRMLASIINRYLKENPNISDEIVNARRFELLSRSQKLLADEIAYIKENFSEVTLYADASLYPLCYTENGVIKGMILEITEIFEQLTGVKIRFCMNPEVQTGSNTMIDTLAEGGIDAIVGSYYNIDAWQNPEVEYSPLLWLETLRTYSYESGNELYGKTLGALEFATDYLGWNNTTGNPPVLFTSHQELLAALKNNEIDAVFMGELRFNYGYSILKDYNLREVTGICAEVPMHLMYAAQNKELNALLNESLTLFHLINPRSMGEWRAQSDKYKADYIRMRNTQQIWATVVIIVFVIMLAALIYLLRRNRKAYKNTKERLVDALDMAHYDELTGIYNRRYMEENLSRIIKLLSRSNGALSVMMLDVDFFKEYNDTYGHSAGDSCLRLVASAINRCMVRSSDFAVRYGGEEFAVVLPNTDEGGARILANRVLESIRECGIPHKNSRVAKRVTISIGVTSDYVGSSQNGVDYIKKADEALYLSKKHGRDRYTFLTLREHLKQ